MSPLVLPRHRRLGTRAVARAVLAGGLTAVLATSLAGCGGGADDAGTSGPTTTTTTTTPVEPAEPTTTTEATDPPPLTAEGVARVVGRVTAPFDSHWVADTSTYDPRATLSVVVASLPLATVTSPQQVFFFHQGAAVPLAHEPRSGIAIGAVEGDTVTVSYAHYAPSDAGCCPSQPAYQVRFQWDGTTVTPLDPYPPADQGWTTELSADRSRQ